MPPVVKAAFGAPAPAAVLSSAQGQSLRELLQEAKTTDIVGASERAEAHTLADQERTTFGSETASQEAADWGQILELVRNFGARVRRAETLAQDLTAQSQAMIESNKAAAEAATARAVRAEVAARDNALALEQLRKQTRLAEERARVAEERMRVVEASEAEARSWLTRICSALRSECSSLGDILVSAKVSGGAEQAERLSWGMIDGDGSRDVLGTA